MQLGVRFDTRSETLLAHANIAVAPIIPAKNAGIKKGKAERGNEPEKFKAAFEMLLPCTRKKSEEEKTNGIQDLE